MRIAMLLVLAMPTLAAADAIMPYPGECPAGSEKRVRNHAETCVPNDCTSADTCPDGLHCVALCTCWAEREVYGRMPTPRMVDTEIGRCDAEGACTEGRVVDRKECQPGAAMDVPGSQSSMTDMNESMNESMQPASMDPESTSSTTTDDGGGCAAAGPLPAFGLAALLLFIRRR